jgi:hypothetical protein
LPTFEPSAAHPEWSGPLLAATRLLFGPEQVSFGGFAIFDGDTPDWLLSHTLEGTRFDLGPLLLSRTFADALPDLAERVDRCSMFAFEQLDAMALAPSLAGVLTAGGADMKRLPHRRAHDLAFDFVNGLLGDAFGQATVLHSRTAWSGWFACDVWDRTWIIADPTTDHIWLLCLTDGKPPQRR